MTKSGGHWSKNGTVKTKIPDIFELAPPRPPTCDLRPSPRSTARCERPDGHEHEHIGRTRGGYWKIWHGKGYL